MTNNSTIVAIYNSHTKAEVAVKELQHFGSAFFMVSGAGPLVMAGPLVGWLVGALEGAVVVGGLSTTGIGFYSLGIPKDSIVQYESALKAGKFVIIAHGNAAEAKYARGVIKRTSPETLEEHQPAPASLNFPQLGFNLISARDPAFNIEL